MIDTPFLTESAPTRTAVVRLTIPRSEIQKVMGPAIGEVFTTLKEQGVAPSGPVFSRHFKIDPQVFDFEVGVPVAQEVTAAGRVQPGELPKRAVARTVYHGPYENLGQAWGEFGEWFKSSGKTAAGDVWESYVAGPESSPDPAQWRTELNRPLAE